MYQTIVITFFCIVITIIDIKTYRIPDILLLIFFFTVIIMQGYQPYTHLIVKFSSSVITMLLFSAVWFYSRGIGLGDVKYAALLGYLLTPEKLIYTFISAAILCVIIYMIGVVLFRWSKITKIPFAPFLSAGVILALTVN